MRNEAPELYGLVLTGGQSSRLQRDKALLDFHGKTQVEYLYGMMGGFCEKVFVSCRKEQGESDGRKRLPQLHDIFFDLGPTGGILTAFSTRPDVAWLVVACDLPFVNEGILTELVNGRNPTKMATAFKAHTNDFPEPVCAIYEPPMKAALMKFVNEGHNCPRKALINSDITLLPSPGKRDLLFNVNTPQDFSSVNSQLSRTERATRRVAPTTGKK